MQGEVWKSSIFPEPLHISRLPVLSHVVRVRGLPGHARQARLSDLPQRHPEGQRHRQEISPRG